jgi:RimJ/RimL family protein N-acetyltransferase
MEYDPAWWQLAFTADHDLVGLVMPARNPTSGTIGYLGVVPEHRGHGYVNDLLGQGTAILHAAGVESIRADVDVANLPMASACRRAGYTAFATRQEYVLQAMHD